MCASAGRGRSCRHHRPGPRSCRAPDRLRPVGSGRPHILIVLDAGYDAPRIAHFLGDLPVEVLGRTRSDRVMRGAGPALRLRPQGRAPPKHGGESSSATPQPGAPSRQ
ncbi:transposase [Streptomyces sp. NPDC051219]|uniref:transposase n=1 Tax=Streptomyces sp. NPDC051219 TaxID=3155283 RepID=UPI0034379AFE